MRKNNGFTLMEVLVSIVIVGIIGICVINLSIYKTKIDKKTTRNLEISNKVTEIFNSFSANPKEFPQLYQDFYDESTNTYKVYFSTSKFDYYLLTYKNYLENEMYYQLDIEIIVDEKNYTINETSKFTRRIYNGD